MREIRTNDPLILEWSALKDQYGPEIKRLSKIISSAEIKAHEWRSNPPEGLRRVRDEEVVEGAVLWGQNSVGWYFAIVDRANPKDQYSGIVFWDPEGTRYSSEHMYIETEAAPTS